MGFLANISLKKPSCYRQTLAPKTSNPKITKTSKTEDPALMSSSQSLPQWYSLLKERKTPHPHIPESEIVKAMPQKYHKAWKSFINGQTGLSLPGDFGVYPWDFGKFVGKIKRIEELQAQEKDLLKQKEQEEDDGETPR